MKNPKEIMKGLECCCDHDGTCEDCPYADGECRAFEQLASDALALIQRLDKDVVETEKLAKAIYDQKNELENKLNQAVEDIRLLGRMEFACPVCAYFNHGEGAKGECVKCLTGDGFRWRGEKEETE